MSDDIRTLQSCQLALAGIDGILEQSADLIEGDTQTIRTRSDEAVSDLSALRTDLGIIEYGLLNPCYKVMLQQTMDRVSPTFDAISDDEYFTLRL